MDGGKGDAIASVVNCLLYLPTFVVVLTAAALLVCCLLSASHGATGICRATT
jgi:hypothetical protein